MPDHTWTETLRRDESFTHPAHPREHPRDVARRCVILEDCRREDVHPHEWTVFIQPPPPHAHRGVCFTLSENYDEDGARDRLEAIRETVAAILEADREGR